jgi:hypothetical protein
MVLPAVEVPAVIPMAHAPPQGRPAFLGLPNRSKSLETEALAHDENFDARHRNTSSASSICASARPLAPLSFRKLRSGCPESIDPHGLHHDGFRARATRAPE